MFFKPNIEKIKTSGDTDRLTGLLKSRNAVVRVNALVALNEIGGDRPDVIESMKRLLNDRDTRVRNRAVLIFARKGDISVLEGLNTIITYGNVGEQTEVLRILPHYFSKDDQKITGIFAIALNDKKQSVQLEAIKSIGEMEIESMAFNLLEFANHSVTRFRLETVISLGRMKSDIGVDVLIGALTDSSPEVRKYAEDSLKRLGTEKAMRALKDAPFMLIVKNMNESVSKRLNTVINIGKQKREFGLPLLHKACYDEYKNIRIEAVKSIARLKDEASIAVLGDLMNDKYYDVRIESIKALTCYNAKTALEIIKIAMNDTNTNVKQEAKRAYAALSARMESLGKI